MFDLAKSWDAFSADKSGYDRRFMYDLFTTRWPIFKFLALWYEERMVMSRGRGDKEFLIKVLDGYKRRFDEEDRYYVC